MILEKEGDEMFKMMNKFIMVFFAVFVLLRPFPAHSSDLSFLSFEHSEMTQFNLPFKQYIASYKIFVEEEKGLDALTRAINRWDDLIVKAKEKRVDKSVYGRMEVVKGLLLQAHGLATQRRFGEARELSIPIRSELFEIHRVLKLLTPEDYMIFFHNGVMHRAEPFIKERRYLELEALIPLIKDTLAKFKVPPKNVEDIALYNKKYKALEDKVAEYIDAIEQANSYVDPEYGAVMLQECVLKAHDKAHKQFGALYLSFPKGMVWPKKR